MIKPYLGVIGKPSNIWLDSYIFIILISCILGFLSVRGCTNASLFLLLIPALFELNTAYTHIKKNKILNIAYPLIITLSLPLLAILISQIFQQKWSIKAWDGPSRIFLSIPLLFYFSYKKIDFSKVVSITAPIALFIIIPLIHLHPEILAKWGGRFATAAVDPTQFGTYTLVLTAFCIFGTKSSSRKLLTLQTAGFLAGLYLIIGSGTRGSWIAIPPLLLLWIMLKKEKMPHPGTFLLLGGGFFSGLILINIFHPTSYDRLISGYHEFSSWMDNSNRETSTGFRLTMWQISWELFKHNPFYGYGDIGFGDYLDESYITSISSPESRQIILYNGPHNEFLANLLRSGFLGGVSVLCLFIIPARVFWQNRHNIQANQASHLGLAFIICLMFCSISSEVLTMKYTATFYGITIAGLTSQIIRAQAEKHSG